MNRKNIGSENYSNFLTKKVAMVLDWLGDEGVAVISVIEVNGVDVGVIKYKKSIDDDTMMIFSDFYGLERKDENDILGKKKCIGLRRSPNIPTQMFILLVKSRVAGVEKGMALKGLINYLIKEKHPYMLN